MENKPMDVKETADYLRISRATLYNLMKKGDIKPFKIGKRTLFDPEDVKKFVEGQKTKSVESTPVKTRKPKKTPKR